MIHIKKHSKSKVKVLSFMWNPLIQHTGIQHSVDSLRHGMMWKVLVIHTLWTARAYSG